MSFVFNSRSAFLVPIFGTGLLVLGAHTGCSDEKQSSIPNGGNGTTAIAVGGHGGNNSASDGGTAGGNGNSCVVPASNCDNNSDPIEPAKTIADFESGSDLIPPREGRTGAWWTAGDKTVGAVISPQGAARPEAIPGGRCASQKALHVTGAGFLDWGATLGLSINYGPNDAGVSEERPWDGSAYKGLTFWAKIGDTSTNNVRLAVSDQYARPEAGLCVVDGPPGKACYDAFSMDLPSLDTTWKKYKVSFDSLEQRGFGVPSTKLDTTQIYQIEFAMPSGAIFDFWLDDLTLY